MAYKPSRTREERKNTPLYVSDNELRAQLEQQALQKRKQKTYEALQEKQEILDHYENFKLPGGESDAELKNFLSQKRQELDVLNKQLGARDPGFPLPPKQPDPRYAQKNEGQSAVPAYDIFSKKPENAFIQGQQHGFKEETEREKRIRLREEERMRRLAGIKESAYESNNKPYLPQPLPEIKQQEKKEDQGSPNLYRKQPTGSLVDLNNKPGGKKNESLPVLDTKQFGEKPDSLPVINSRRESERLVQQDILQRNQPQEETEKKGSSPYKSSPQEIKRSPSIKAYEGPGTQEGGLRRMSTQGEKVEQGNGMFSRMGSQAGLSEAEKKKKYREELDMIVKQKKEMQAKDEKEVQRSASRGNIDQGKNGIERGLNRMASYGYRGEEKEAYKYSTDRDVLDSEAKKKQYADELMKDILTREKIKKEEKDAEILQRREFEVVEDKFMRGDNVRRGVGLNDINNAGQNESDKKKKYKEILDAQVEERKRIQSAKTENRRDNNYIIQGNAAERFEKIERKVEEVREERRVDNKDDNFFLFKAEDEDKQRAQARNLQKQKMADDLKKQMEEKEEQKRKERLRKAEEDLQEKERIQRDIEKEKMREQEELHKKQLKKRESFNKDNMQEKVQQSSGAKQKENDSVNRVRQENPLDEREQRYREEYNNNLMSNQNVFDDNRGEGYGENNQNQYMRENNYYSNNPNQGINPNINSQPYYSVLNHMHAPQYGYAMQGNLYQDMTAYNQLMHQLVEEKLKIEKIILEEQRVFEEYQNKIKEIQLEKAQYDKESEKIKQILQGKIALTPSTIDFINKSPGKNNQNEKLAMLENSYLPALLDLKNAKASHLSNYNKLLFQSQSQIAQIKSPKNPPVKGPLSSHLGPFNLGDTMRSQAFGESGLIRQPLPASDELCQISESEFQKSYLRDLEDFQKAAQGLNLGEDMSLEAYSAAIQNFNLTRSSLNMSSTLPMVSEFRPLSTIQRDEEEKAYSNIQEPTNRENPIIRIQESAIEKVSDRMPLQSGKDSFISSKEIPEFGPGRASGVRIEPSISQIHRVSSDIPFRSMEESSKDQNSLFKRESMQLRSSESREKEEEYVFGNSPSKVGKSGHEGLKLHLNEKKDKKPHALGEDDEDYYQDEFEELIDSGDEGSGKKRFDKNERFDDTPKQKKVDNIARPHTNKESSYGKLKDDESGKKWGSQQKMSMNEIARETASPARVSTQERKFRSPKTLDPFTKARESEEKILSSKAIKGNHQMFSEWDQFEEVSGKKADGRREEQRGLSRGSSGGEGIRIKEVKEEPKPVIDKGKFIEDEDFQELEYDKFGKTLKPQKYGDKKEEDTGILRRSKDVDTENEQRSKMIFDRLQNLLNDFENQDVDERNQTIREEDSEMEYTAKGNNIFKSLGGSKNYSNRYTKEDR